jgi:hypothetical protein
LLPTPFLDRQAKFSSNQRRNDVTTSLPHPLQISTLLTKEINFVQSCSMSEQATPAILPQRGELIQHFHLQGSMLAAFSFVSNFFKEIAGSSNAIMLRATDRSA